MHYLRALACALALAPSVVFSAPPAPQPPQPPRSEVNPYIGKEVYANKGYAKKLEETIQYFNQRYDYYNAAKTKTVQKIPTFAWISSSADISNIKGLVKETLNAQVATKKKQILQLVVYNLPDRDCSAKASDGEFHLDDDGLNKYKNYIDTIARELNTPDAKKLNFVVILEPDSLGNAVTNLNVPKCAKAAPAYKEGISYAIAKLQHPNLSIYIDAAHGGWLGWDDNLAPTAALFAEVLQGAQAITPGATVRGVAINVSNYNQYIAPIRENFTEWSNSWDESHYVESLTPHLERAGFPAHFIVDQGRSGKAGVRTEWGQWCNVKYAGFGTRPTADQAVLKNPHVDAIVWVKPGGESDGTSDRNAARFDEVCAGPVAHVPAPEAGAWFNEYVVNLVKEANPELQATWSWP
ncbi:Exoglucanase 3 [Psilocybe cubensis]|uniref:Exoglucanase 3 n=1 Tax=Psilocybe cubensis TaxID=181762 RepID=A0ACB8HJ17_PSICU|nr:Exoglucanase 3 [Psilocybe cubensis]KAH9487325.1 Exoglucanase 3 [Psilocybe cubensis]